MRFWPHLCALMATASMLCCRQVPEEPPLPADVFWVKIHHHVTSVETRHAAFLSDEDGKVRAFAWLPPGDTLSLRVSGVLKGERFDLTVFEMTTVLAPGSGVRDTTVHLRTYTDIENGAEVHLRDRLLLSPERYTDLIIRLRDVHTLDSMVVPGAIAFAVPQADNGFQGQYRIFHTGAFWLRLKANGEPFWRYRLFSSINGDVLDVETSVQDLPLLTGEAVRISLPFFTAWTHRLDRVIDLSGNRFLPLDPPLPIPGGAVPVFDEFSFYEPPLPAAQGYRLQLWGTDPTGGAYGYRCDRFFPARPSQAPPAPADVSPTALSGNRLVAAIPNPHTVLLRFVRYATPGLSWEVLVEPTPGRPVAYRLPDVPAAPADLFAALKNYSFGPTVEVHAEHYESLKTYREVLRQFLSSEDPLWPMKAGYTARVRVF